MVGTDKCDTEFDIGW